MSVRRKVCPVSLDRNFYEARERARYVKVVKIKELATGLKTLERFYALLYVCHLYKINYRRKDIKEFMVPVQALVMYALCHTTNWDQDRLNAHMQMSPEELKAAFPSNYERKRQQFLTDIDELQTAFNDKDSEFDWAERQFLSLIRDRKFEDVLVEDLSAYANPVKDWEGVEGATVVRQVRDALRSLEKKFYEYGWLFLRDARRNPSDFERMCAACRIDHQGKDIHLLCAKLLIGELPETDKSSDPDYQFEADPQLANKVAEMLRGLEATCKDHAAVQETLESASVDRLRKDFAAQRRGG